jgi:4-hydroxythreonine-4-phosphate dehydrogenase
VRALILADDLTGAADCGVQAVRGRLRATVSLGGAVAGADVLAVDVDTRERSAAVARERRPARPVTRSCT